MRGRRAPDGARHLRCPRPSFCGGKAGFSTFQHNTSTYFLGAIDCITLHDAPLDVAGQELCRQGYDELKLKMEGARGYRVFGYAAVASSDLCGEADGQINLVGSLGTWGGIVLRDQYTGQATEGAIRGYACMNASAYLLAWWTCSTHITSKTAADATAQANQMRTTALFLNDRAVIVSGDFNRTPGQTGPAAWYTSFREAGETYDDPTYSKLDGAVPTKKIDHIFSVALRTDAAGGDARLGCSQVATGSDHCFIHGFHRFVW